jgi:hypothetical protein
MKKLLSASLILILCLGYSSTTSAQTENEAATKGIQKYLATKYSKEAPESRKFIYAAVDLNDDGKEEYIVGLVGSSFCGSGGCNMLVLTSSFKANSSFTVVGFPVYVGPPASKEVTKKYSNLYVYSKGKGYVKLVWNGTKYGPSNASMAPSVPESIITGKYAFLDEKTVTQYSF